MSERFERFEAIAWWQQAKLAEAKVLVIGAGALGNEVIKNLALLGTGHVIVVDMDLVEESNLSRSVLFRPEDEGLPKAECAARRARELYPDMRIVPVVGNVLADVGLGLFRWADAVIGAVDNREARVFINASCAKVGRVWFDGGIDVLNGVVRGFRPPATACYECTMTETDWKALAQRRSCALVAHRAARERGTPTTPTVASVIGALQVQEVVKYLHGLDALLGKGFVLDGLSHSSYAVGYPILPDCPWHDEAPPIEALAMASATTCVDAVWREAERRLGTVEELELSREIVERLQCPRCGRASEILRPLEKVGADDVVCADCGVDRVPSFVHALRRDSALGPRTLAQIGLPPCDIVWARAGSRFLGLELAGDEGGAST